MLTAEGTDGNHISPDGSRPSRTSWPCEGKSVLIIIVMIVIVAILVPAMPGFPSMFPPVPPLVIPIPATLPFRIQIATPILGLVAALTMLFDSFVQP